MSNDTDTDDVAHTEYSEGYGEIPYNFALNVAIFVGSVAVFTFLKRHANSEHARSVPRLLKGWLQIIYGDNEDELIAKQPTTYYESHIHELRYAGILLSPARLEALKVDEMEDKIDENESIDRIRFLRLTEDNESDDEHFDRHDNIAEYIHEHMDFNMPTETKMTVTWRSSGNWLLDVFMIRDKDISSRRGRDAVDYLIFQRYLIIFLIVLTVICLVIILPINLQGTKADASEPFLRTTINNIDSPSTSTWFHVLVSIILYPFGAFLMCHFSNTIDVDNEDVCKRTLLIRRLPTTLRSKQTIINEFQKHIPEVKITAVQFVYDSRNLKAITLDYANVVDAKYFCEEYIHNFGDRFEGRPYLFGLLGGLFCCCYCCPKVDGLDYYTNKQKELENEIKKEYELCLNDPKGLVFITLETEEMAISLVRLINHQRDSRHCLTNFALDYIWRCRECVNPVNEVDFRNWEIRFAPFPDDINWDTLAMDYRTHWCRRFFVHTFLLIIFFFFTTPSIILQAAERRSSIVDKIKIFTPQLSAYITPLILVLSGNLLQVFVKVGTEMLPHRTISDKNHSIMVRTFVFLLFMIVILPSLGVTSVMALLNTAKENGSITLTQITTGSGALFTNYVIQSALLSNALELLRVADVCVYFLYFIFFSLTVAEVKNTREMVIYEFQYGAQYSKMMLVFFIVAAYSITTPIITIFGLLHMLIEHAVDRYNIYFVNSSSRIDVRTHSTAIIFFHISLMAMQLRLLSVLIPFEPFSVKLIILGFVVALEVVLFCFQFYNNYYYGVFAFDRREKKYFQEWCACSYVPTEIWQVMDRGLVPLNITSVKNQMKKIQVIEPKRNQIKTT